MNKINLQNDLIYINNNNLLFNEFNKYYIKIFLLIYKIKTCFKNPKNNKY